MSRHCTPASASARRIATAPISIAVVSPNRPNGCSPTPMMATSSTAVPLSADRLEGEGQHVVSVLVRAERNDDKFHLHSDAQAPGVRLGEPALDFDFVRELDVTDAVGNELMTVGAGVRR